MKKQALTLAILGGLILAATLISWFALPGWRQTTGGFWLLLAAAATGVVAFIKAVLDILKELQELGKEKENKMPKDKPTINAEAKPGAATGGSEAQTRALGMARRALAILEEQAAGYTALTIPAHLKIQLEEKRREVAELERR